MRRMYQLARTMPFRMVTTPPLRQFSTIQSSVIWPTGTEDFSRLIEKRLNFVDKSLFIKDILDDTGTDVVLITRPRRFGKTLNLSMLEHFLAKEVSGALTAGLFDGLKIIESGDRYMQHQGKYPVISVTFKDMKHTNFSDAYEHFIRLMSNVFKQHYYLLDSSKRIDIKEYTRIVEKQGTKVETMEALKTLTGYLFLHHGVRPWLLIDEYDTPIIAAYNNGYYNEMIELMRGCFGAALKTNKDLGKAVITGILRIAKEGLFSGVNNVEVYSFLQDRYGEHFGFTQSEVIDVLKQSGLEDRLEEVTHWYNGYQSGKTVIYNPWSIVHYAKNKAPGAYWINTSNNQVIRDILVNSSPFIKSEFSKLLNGEAVEGIINEHTTFGDLKNNPDVVWSLLFMSGYLKVVEKTIAGLGYKCKFVLPNHEVKGLFCHIIEQWLANSRGVTLYNRSLVNLLNGDIEEFKITLHNIMTQIASSHDLSNEPERFYHAVMLGLVAHLNEDNNYEIKSNRESGYGRYDLLILSRDPKKLTILFEFKKVPISKSSNQTEEQIQTKLEEAALEALEQIDTQQYASEPMQRNVKSVLKIGLAFSGKRFAIEHDNQSINKEDSLLKLRLARVV